MSKTSSLIVKAIILIFSLFSTAQGFDFGKRANIFAIKEEGFVAMIMRKLQGIDLEKENEKMKQIAVNKVENPTPVAGISSAVEDREFWHDPTYTLPEDAVLPCGKILHKAGTTVNPLEHMNLERRLFFVDGRELKQIQWLKEQLSEHSKEQNSPTQNVIILVAGSVLKLQEELGTRVYFDQSGEITGKWGIKASPAIADQDGKRLRITEVYIEK